MSTQILQDLDPITVSAIQAIAAMIKDLLQQDMFGLYDLFLVLSFANN